MSNAKRGREWEDILTRSFRYLSNCTVEKLCAPVRVVRWPGARPGRKNSGEFVGYFEAKGVCDYEGAYKGRVVCIEAKRTMAERWSLSSVKTHQWDRMRRTHEYHEGICGVMLAWDDPKGSTAFFAISYRALDLLAEAGVKSMHPKGMLELADASGTGIEMLPVRPCPEGIVLSLEHWMQEG